MSEVKYDDGLRIAQYLDEPQDESHNLALIDTCIRVIGAYEASDPRRDFYLVDAAVESLLTWMGDYGVSVKEYSVYDAPLGDL